MPLFFVILAVPRVSERDYAECHFFSLYDSAMAATRRANLAVTRIAVLKAALNARDGGVVDSGPLTTLQNLIAYVRMNVDTYYSKSLHTVDHVRVVAFDPKHPDHAEIPADAKALVANLVRFSKAAAADARLAVNAADIAADIYGPFIGFAKAILVYADGIDRKVDSTLSLATDLEFYARVIADNASELAMK